MILQYVAKYLQKKKKKSVNRDIFVEQRHWSDLLMDSETKRQASHMFIIKSNRHE